MTIFSAAVDAIYATDLADDATYYRPNEAPKAVRVILREEDAEFAPLVGPGMTTPSRRARVRVSDIAIAAKGDTFRTADGSFDVQKATLRRRGLEWRLLLKAGPA